MKATLANHNQSPRKTRLVTDLVKGKTVPEALAALAFLPKRAALPVKKLIESAIANAKAAGADAQKLRVKSITVDSAGMTVRYMPRAMGRATPIRRRRSRIRVLLEAGSRKSETGMRKNLPTSDLRPPTSGV